MPHSTYASCFSLCRWPLPFEFFSVFAPRWGRGLKPDHFLPDLTAVVKTVLLGHLELTCGFLKGRSLSVLYTIFSSILSKRSKSNYKNSIKTEYVQEIYFEKNWAKIFFVTTSLHCFQVVTLRH